jgi:hypothetical protein
LSSIWRTSREPRLIHWLVGGTAIAGDYKVYEEHDFVACGAEVPGCYVGDEERWGRGTMVEHPVTCPKCLELFHAAERS